MNKNSMNRFITITIPIVVIIEIIQILLFKMVINVGLSIMMSISYLIISILYSIGMYLWELNRNTNKNLEFLLIFRPIAMMVTFTICSVIFLKVMTVLQI